MNFTKCRWIFASLLMIISLLITGDAGWVDPDTNFRDQVTRSLDTKDDRHYELIFSDEFKADGRTFADGQDPKWTAINKNDYTNDALHFYSSDNAKTANGTLHILTEHKTNKYVAFDEKKKVFFSDAKHIQSAMLQGWNKFCFTGGIVEIRAKLPGKAEVGGLWPALWLLGNLARATYVGSSDFMWPWSYNKCTKETMLSQEVTACNKVNHYGMHQFQGRGAPEIDLLEAMGGPPGKIPHTPIQRPYFSSSLQIAPGVRHKRPVMGQQPVEGHWYSGLHYGNETKTALNPFFYGVTLVHKPSSYTYQADALSANTQINQSYFDEFHTYRVEWEPSDYAGRGGHIKWHMDGKFLYGFNSSVLNLTGSMIPNEPMYILLNTAVSSNWGFPKPCPDDCDCSCFQCGNPECECGLPDDFCSNIPSTFEIDYVRVYQAVDEVKHNIGCSTASHPTALFIKGHKDRYMTEAEKDTLLPVMKGGGPCDSNDDCRNKGKCSSQKKCSCVEKFTGPQCLAPEGFDDKPHPLLELPLRLHSFLPPASFLLIFGILVIGLVSILVSEVLKKRGRTEGFSDHFKRTSFYSPSRLQTQKGIPIISDNSYNSERLNRQSHVATYCVIDQSLLHQ